MTTVQSWQNNIEMTVKLQLNAKIVLKVTRKIENLFSTCKNRYDV